MKKRTKEMAPFQGLFCAIGFTFVQRLVVGNRLEPIAVRRCGVFGRRVFVVVGKYDGGLRATGR